MYLTNLSFFHVNRPKIRVVKRGEKCGESTAVKALRWDFRVKSKCGESTAVGFAVGFANFGIFSGIFIFIV